MILKTLRLKNFRKFEDSSIEFPDGVAGIIGFNGVGKSTIFEAIAWTLYGPIAARTPVDQIKRIHTAPSDPCRVELEFSFADDSYRVVREMKGKHHTASATVMVNRKLAVNGADPTSRYMQKRLGMDARSFFTSIYARQKELNALSSMNASERRPLILKMLGVDALDDILGEIRSDRRTKDSLLERLELDLIDESGQEKVKILEEKIQQHTVEKETIHQQIIQTQQTIKKMEKIVTSAEKTYNQVKSEYDQLRKEKEEYDDRKNRYDKKQQLQEEIQNLDVKVQERKKQVEKHTIKLKKFDNKEQELSELEKQQHYGEKTLGDLIKKIEQKKTTIGRLKQDVKEIESKKTGIEKMGPSSKCPTCEKVLGEQYHKLLDQFTNTIREKNQEISALSEQTTVEQTAFEKLSRQKEALRKKQTYLQGLLREKEQITTMIQSINQEIQSEEKERNDKQKQLKRLGPVAFNETTYQQLMHNVDTAYNKLQTALDEVTEQRKQLGGHRVTLEKKQGEEKLIIQQIASFQKAIKEQNQLKKRIQREKTEVQNLRMLQEIMTSFRTHLISRIRPTLSAYASDLFEQLTDGKYREIELDENYNLMVYDNGQPYKIERFSGGEEDLANLCLRLAISEVITEQAGSLFQFIILDEIFGSQDSLRQQNIIRALHSLSAKFRQLFLITHIDEIKNYMENTVTVIEDTTGVSTLQIE
jgi:exonuclease SbcC